MSDKHIVQTFGLHRQDEFIWLHEQHRTICLTPGYDQLPSPFEVRMPPRLRCPHLLHPPVPGTTPTEAWIRACAPIPQDGLYWCHPAKMFLLTEAARWMIPRAADPVVQPWWGSGRGLASRLTLTNVTPLLVSDYRAEDFREVMTLARLPRTRSLILSGYPKLGMAQDITPGDDECVRLPNEWEAVAGAFLWNYIKEIQV